LLVTIDVWLNLNIFFPLNLNVLGVIKNCNEIETIFRISLAFLKD